MENGILGCSWCRNKPCGFCPRAPHRQRHSSISRTSAVVFHPAIMSSIGADAASAFPGAGLTLTLGEGWVGADWTARLNRSWRAITDGGGVNGKVGVRCGLGASVRFCVYCPVIMTW